MDRRIRIGLLVPAVNQTLEPDFYRVVPPAVTVHAERMWNSTSKGPADEGPGHLEELNSDMARAARYVARVRPDLIVYGCTSGSFWQGLESESSLKRHLEEIAGAPAITTSSASVAAMQSLGVRRISVMSPYGKWVNERLRAFLQAAGFEVLVVEGEPSLVASGAVEEIGNQPPEVIRRFVRAVIHPESDGVFLSCTAWRGMETVDGLEEELNRPVVTANQATIWQTLQRLGASPRPGGGGGRLLRSLGTRSA